MGIIITGGTKGIGKAIAEQFARNGNQIIICSRNASEAEKVAASLSASHPETIAMGVQADLSVKKEVIQFGELCLAKFTPTVLVNNTGTFLPGNVLDEADGTLEKLLAVNLVSAYYLCRIIGNEMKKNRSGHIFNISSIAGLKAYDGGGSYSISKFAMNGLSVNLRHELMPFGVKVTNVLPGAVFTDSWAGYDNSAGRLMEAEDIGKSVYAVTQLSAQAVVEEIIIRPQLGDL